MKGMFDPRITKMLAGISQNKKKDKSKAEGAAKKLEDLAEKIRKEDLTEKIKKY